MSRLCVTQHPLCTGLNPCDGCHAVRSQILARSLHASGYQDAAQLQVMFAHVASLSNQARSELEAALPTAPTHEPPPPPLEEDLFDEPAPIPPPEEAATPDEPLPPTEEELGEAIVSQPIGKENVQAILAEAEANRTGQPLTRKPKPPKRSTRGEEQGSSPAMGDETVNNEKETEHGIDQA